MIDVLVLSSFVVDDQLGSVCAVLSPACNEVKVLDVAISAGRELCYGIVCLACIDHLAFLLQINQVMMIKYNLHVTGKSSLQTEVKMHVPMKMARDNF